MAPPVKRAVLLGIDDAYGEFVNRTELESLHQHFDPAKAKHYLQVSRAHASWAEQPLASSSHAANCCTASCSNQ